MRRWNNLDASLTREGEERNESRSSLFSFKRSHSQYALMLSRADYSTQEGSPLLGGVRMTISIVSEDKGAEE